MKDRKAVPRGVWALGFVSMFMDISSEMIHSLLPVFMVSVLGASAIWVGAIEGIAEATASVTKIFSGVISDYLGRRKALTVIGYGLGALSKPLFPLAPDIVWVLGARCADRIGKGIRGAPRDALVADLTPPEFRGAAYGLRQSLDTVGAFSGPLLAIGLMALTRDDFRVVFWIAAVPAAIAVALLIVGVREPVSSRPPGTARLPIRRNELKRLGGFFWVLIAISTILMLARFSEAFLVLRADSVGVPLALLPLTLVMMNLVYAGSAYPMGLIADRVDRRAVAAAGFAPLIIADLVLASADGPWLVFLGIGLWGLHMGMTQGALAALVADAAPETLRGTAFGVFNLATGISALLSSLAAGVLWDRLGAPTTFLSAAAIIAIGLIGAAVVVPLRR